MDCDRKLLKMYNKIQKKNQQFNEKKIGIESMYGYKNKRTKRKSYGDTINKNVQGKKLSKQKLHVVLICL